MGVKFEGKSYAGNMPVFWRGEAKILPGGYKLLQTFPKGTVIPKGTPLHIVIGTLTAAVSKYAKVVSGGTTTKPRVPKGTLFQINDIVMKEGETTGVTVSSIDTSNADYDVLTLSSAISGLAADDVLIEATATSSSAAKYEPNAVVGEDTEPLAGIIIFQPTVACHCLIGCACAGTSFKSYGPGVIACMQRYNTPSCV